MAYSVGYVLEGEDSYLNHCTYPTRHQNKQTCILVPEIEENDPLTHTAPGHWSEKSDNKWRHPDKSLESMQICMKKHMKIRTQ